MRKRIGNILIKMRGDVRPKVEVQILCDKFNDYHVTVTKRLELTTSRGGVFISDIRHYEGVSSDRVHKLNEMFRASPKYIHELNMMDEAKEGER